MHICRMEVECIVDSGEYSTIKGVCQDPFGKKIRLIPGGAMDTTMILTMERKLADPLLVDQEGLSDHTTDRVGIPCIGHPIDDHKGHRFFSSTTLIAGFIVDRTGETLNIFGCDLGGNKCGMSGKGSL